MIEAIPKPHSTDLHFLDDYQLTFAIIKNSSYKMLAGEIFKAAVAIRPSVKKGTISRYLSRLVAKGLVARTDFNSNNKYWYDPPVKKISSGEFKVFWDPDLPLYVHGLLIIVEGVMVHKKEVFHEPFLDYTEQIRFECTPRTKRIRIDFGCSNWKRSLDCANYSYFVDTIKRVLRLKGFTYKEMYIRNCHYNQDNEKYELDGSNRIKLQVFTNTWLNIYNKKDGIRPELQLTKMKLHVNHARKILQKETEALRIGDVFHQTQLVLRKNEIAAEIIKNYVQRSETTHKYLGNVVQQLDESIYNSQDTIKQLQTNDEILVDNQEIIVDNQLQLAQIITNNKEDLAKGHDVTQKLLLDHDSQVDKKFDNLQDTIELKQYTIDPIEAYSIPDKILQVLRIKNRTIYDLVDILGLNYKQTYHHISQLIKKNKLEYLGMESKTGVGARRKLLRIKIKGDD